MRAVGGGSACVIYGWLVQPVIAAITAQAIVGLKHLHSNRMMHRDIKGANLLLCRSFHAQLPALLLPVLISYLLLPLHAASIASAAAAVASAAVVSYAEAKCLFRAARSSVFCAPAACTSAPYYTCMLLPAHRVLHLKLPALHACYICSTMFAPCHAGCATEMGR